MKPPDAVAGGEFGHIESLRELRDGRVLVSEHARGRGAMLFAVGWDQTEPRTVGRVGSGPGEYRAAGLLFPLAAESTLMTDGFNARALLLARDRIVSTALDREPVTTLAMGELWGADSSGRVLGASGAVFRTTGPRLRETADSFALLLGDRRSGRRDTLLLLAGAGAIMHRLTIPGMPPTVIIGTPFSSNDRALLFPDGWIAVVHLRPYRVDWRRPDGQWVRGPLLPFRPLRVTARERAWAMGRAYGRAVRDPGQLTGWPDIIPPFLWWNRNRAPILLALPDGRLAIARTPTAQDSSNRYDLVDRRGALTGVLQLPANEAIVGFGARAVYVVATDADEIQRLRRHPWP